MATISMPAEEGEVAADVHEELVLARQDREHNWGDDQQYQSGHDAAGAVPQEGSDAQALDGDQCQVGPGAEGARNDAVCGDCVDQPLGSSMAGPPHR